MRRRHDPFLKLLYRAGARDAVALFFPDLADLIDWEHLQWIEKEVPIPSRPPRSVVADLVGLTRDREGRSLELLIHPEIQMQTDAEIGWRMLQYNAGLTLQQASPNVRVLTFVFYHCPRAGGVEEESYGLEFGGRTVLGVGYWSVGLGDLQAEQYADRPNPMAWALTAWMRQRQERRVELRLQLLVKILRRVRDEPYRHLLLDAVRSYFTLSRTEQAEERRLLQSRSYGEVNKMLQTELGRLQERARREGARQARQEMQTELGQLEEHARREGARQARWEALQSGLAEVVRSRFSVLLEEMEARMRLVEDPTKLQELIRQAATATSLDEISTSLEQ